MKGGGIGGGGGSQVFDMNDDGLFATGVNPNLTFDQIYALTAFILFRNGIIKEDDVMNRETLPKVVMPNRNGFLPRGQRVGNMTFQCGSAGTPACDLSRTSAQTANRCLQAANQSMRYSLRPGSNRGSS